MVAPTGEHGAAAATDGSLVLVAPESLETLAAALTAVTGDDGADLRQREREARHSLGRRREDVTRRGGEVDAVTHAGLGASWTTA